MSGRSAAPDIEVWRIPLVGDAVWTEGVVTDRELDRANAYSSPDARRRWLIARAAMRTILGAASGADPASLDISVGPHGKPLAVGVEFNLTDSGNLALLAVADRPVGIDLERVRADRPIDRLAIRVMTDAELQAFRRSEDRVEAFFRTWTRKEAVAKAIGRGIGIGLRAVDVASERPAIRGVVQDRWWILTLAADRGHVAALCAERPESRIIYRLFESP